MNEQNTNSAKRCWTPPIHFHRLGVDDFVVNQDQIDFAVRYPWHFKRVFGRRLNVKPSGNGLFVIFVSIETIEFLEESKIGRTGIQAYNSDQQ